MKYLLLVIILLLSQSVLPQVKQIGIPHVRNYEASAIQAGPQTWAIDICGNGLAYFANNDGVLEFDGLHWRKYPLPGGIVVRSVMSAGDGRVYAGGFNQIGFFSPDSDGKMTYTSLNEMVPVQYKNFGEVWKIYELPYGIVFQSYKQLMLYHDKKMHVIKAPVAFHFSYLVNNELFVNDQKEGLFRLAHDRLVKMPGTDMLKGELIWSMLPKGSNILIATADKGIYEYDGMHLWEFNTAASGIFRESQIYCGLVVSENVYAFGTILDGLVLCDADGNILQHINLERGLQNSTVLSMKLDQYQNLWLGLDNGIDYVEINSPLTYFTHINGLSTGYAAVLHDGLIYLGTNRGLFYHKWETLKNNGGSQEFQIIPGTQGQVWELKVVDGNLFCGHNNGVFIIDGLNARKISDVQGGWTFIQPEGRGDLLICGTYAGLVKFEKENGFWGEGKIIKGFNESSRIMANADGNMMWITHGYIGVFRIHFDERHDSVTKVELFNSKHGFPGDENINVFTVDGKTIFTTTEGFYKYDVRTNSFVPDEITRKMFPGEDIHKLYQDNRGNVWYFTLDNVGVFRLQEDGNYFKVDVPFREMTGKFIKWFQFVYTIEEDHVFFGIQDGFVHYSPEFPKNYQHELKAYIREVKLTVPDSVIYHGGFENKKITGRIPFRYNQLQFVFSANDFENPQHLKFSTFLEGFDSDWSAWHSRSSREFTNLDHGQHIFRVKAMNIFGTESNVSSFIFEIAPPWYKKWWAWVIYFLVCVGFVVLLSVYVRFRMNRSKLQEQERQKQKFLEMEKKLQTEALEAEKEVIRLRNEKLSAEMKQKDRELANSTLQMIQKSKSLIAIRKELSRFSAEIGDEILSGQINLIIRKINREINAENQWEVFEKHFESVHEEFLKRLKARYLELTPRELLLCAYLRLNITSKEIAALMNISVRGVEISRYRLRRKLNLDHDTNLTGFIMSF